MRIKTKGIIKKIALVLAGVVALSAVGFGVAKLVEFVKDDLKTISPVFDVGNLGTDGKFVDDESTLYTKEAFACDGLQIKLDFDNQIEYQIYFYDDLDNFVESTEVYNNSSAPLILGTYARIVIDPTDNEDEELSIIDVFNYSSQMKIKVNKVQDISSYIIGGRSLITSNNVGDLVFRKEKYNIENDFWEPHSSFGTTSLQLLHVKGYSTLNFSATDPFEGFSLTYSVHEYDEVDGKLTFIKTVTDKSDSYTFSENSEYILVSFYIQRDGSPTEFDENLLTELNYCISLSK